MKSAALVHGAGALLVIGGLCFWGNKLLDFAPPAKAAPAQALPAPDRAAQVLAQWLGPGALRLNVVVMGLAQRSDRAVALLSVNGAAAKSYLVGESLVNSIRLLAIEADGVVLEHAGRVHRVAAPARPAIHTAGIAPAR